MQIIKKSFLAMFILFATPSYFYAVEPVTIILAIGTGISSLCQTYSVGKDIYQEVCPNDQAQVNNLAAEEKLEYLKARKAFKICLFDTTPSSERNEKNIPTICQTQATAFIKCGGRSEIIEMIQNLDDSHEPAAPAKKQ